MPAPTLGQRLRSARQREGLTQQALADRIKVSQGAIANWEAGSPFDSPTRQKIEKILGPLTNKKQATAIPAVEEEPSSFGTWVREKRSKDSLSVPELAKKANISAQAIYNIENGRIKNPQATTRNKLAAAFNEKIPAGIVEEIEEEQNIQGLGSLIDFDPADKAEWPQCAGVYVLYDVSQRPIYVGKADKIASRLSAHEQKFWFRHPIVAYGSYIEVKDKVMRHQLEQVLIKFLKSNAVINKQSVEDFNDD
jgi:transcriptional regulator with XRE-family HTH domain